LLAKVSPTTRQFSFGTPRGATIHHFPRHHALAMLLKKAFPNDPLIGTSAFAMPKKIVSATSLVADTVGGR
jgi:hypothetical protein